MNQVSSGIENKFSGLKKSDQFLIEKDYQNRTQFHIENDHSTIIQANYERMYKQENRNESEILHLKNNETNFRQNYIQFKRNECQQIPQRKVPIQIKQDLGWNKAISILTFFCCNCISDSLSIRTEDVKFEKSPRKFIFTLRKSKSLNFGDEFIKELLDFIHDIPAVEILYEYFIMRRPKKDNGLFFGIVPKTF
jgi:hypothetical protein